MPDYSQMLELLDTAEANVNKAAEALHPLDSITQLEAYVLGLLRGAQLTVAKAKEGVQQTIALRRRKLSKGENEPDPDNQP